MPIEKTMFLVPETFENMWANEGPVYKIPVSRHEIRGWMILVY